MSDEREYEDFESEPSIATPMIDTFAVGLAVDRDCSRPLSRRQLRRQRIRGG